MIAVENGLILGNHEALVMFICHLMVEPRFASRKKAGDWSEYGENLEG
jgi:hypothetical protein